MAPFKKVAK